MRARVLAWVCLAAVVYCLWIWASGWRNPLASVGSLPVPGVTQVMPRMPDGCAKRPECL